MRIFKGTEITLKLYLPSGCGAENYDGLQAVLYTADPNNFITIKDVKIEGDMAYVTVPEDGFTSMDEGVITYIINNENMTFSIERQSSYYLKETVTVVYNKIEPLREVVYTENGEYTIEPNEGYHSIGKVEIDVQIPIEEIEAKAYENGILDQKAKLEDITITQSGLYEKEDGYKSINVDVEIDPKMASSYMWWANYLDTKPIDATERATGYFVNFLLTTAVNEGGRVRIDFPEEQDLPFMIEYGRNTENCATSFEGPSLGHEKSHLIYFDGMLCGTLEKIISGMFGRGYYLSYIGPMKNLGESFTEPQTLDLSKSSYLFNMYYQKYSAEFIDSLYDLSNGNKNGVNTSTIKIHRDSGFAQYLNENADALSSKGWIAEIV